MVLLVQEGTRIPDDYLPANLDPGAVGLHNEACEGFAGRGPGVRISAGQQEVPGEDRDGGSDHNNQTVAKMLSGFVHICSVQEMEMEW